MADSSEGQMDGVSSSSMLTSPIASRSSSFMTPSPPLPVASPSIANLSLDRLEQENRVLKIEIDTLKLRIKSLLEENKSLRLASVSIQAKAEQEEEFISNTLLKRIQTLKKEKETLALNYEHEEECLTNDLSRKLNQLRAEKVQLEHTLEQEQEALVNKLMRKIEKLENETLRKQSNLEQLRREKIELENTLEQEQEALVNKLWKRMDKLENEKRDLHEKLETLSAASGCSLNDISNSASMTPAQSPGPQPMSPMASTSAAFNNFNNSIPPSAAPLVLPSTRSNSNAVNCLVNDRNGSGFISNDPAQLSSHVKSLRSEVVKLRNRLQVAEREHNERMTLLEKDEREQREQNIRLRRKLQMEIERRERLSRHLSESESSLEIEFDDRNTSNDGMNPPPPATCGSIGGVRQRTLSSPVPMNVAMSSPTSSTKAPPPTPLTISSPISHEHLMPRPISPISRHKTVCCPKCGHSFLASIGSYTNLFANSSIVTANATASAHHFSSPSSNIFAQSIVGPAVSQHHAANINTPHHSTTSSQSLRSSVSSENINTTTQDSLSSNTAAVVTTNNSSNRNSGDNNIQMESD